MFRGPVQDQGTGIGTRIMLTAVCQFRVVSGESTREGEATARARRTQTRPAPELVRGGSGAR